MSTEDVGDDLLETVDDEEEEEAMTAPEVLHKLEEAWLNEKFSPDLLPVKSNLVECMLDQIVAMENNISTLKKGDFRISVHRMEIDRIRYVISSYLRHRLAKIESLTTHVLQEEEKRRDSENVLMSPAELEFAKGYCNSVMTHLTNTALDHMPLKAATPNAKEIAVLPNLDSYVFLKVNENTENVLVEEETVDAREEIMDFEKGDQHIMRYKPIASLVESGGVSLI
ncbi:DNA replication complex GINS protein SLD5-like [Biomphalaria glabrata]|uniref:DNA replication complex GINS protein SLD5 n=1 Tax=Biomphalaria glabrata TaxID=6526 RepID=A0A9W2YKQ0_BIOGL|nr:DNA replication complex GINS protein SLD5-like [Biomphalaria glabrata]XP_055863355.1 DNA replication complex GINS protein SLD5-like [Biomphalaria glabrata]XP_055863361.1 DNA replication complex GINS protein SLD5-like [Biomphalaria glabrata]XP_055863368.1 DNA replication complex GINS protein SLD5-like [Biomphalaria glabrata]